MRLEGLGRLFCVRMVVPDFLWGNGCSSLGQSRRRDEQTKKSRATNVPGKFIREASRLGDVGPFAGPWVSRTRRPAKDRHNRSGRKLCTAVRRLPLRFEWEDSVFDDNDHCQIAFSAMHFLHKCSNAQITGLSY